MLKLRDLLPGFHSKSTGVSVSSVSGSGTSRPLTFLDFLLNRSAIDLAAHITITYYKRIAPIATAIDMISGNVADIEPLLFDSKTNEFIKDHPLLELLQNPNADSTYTEFMVSLAALLRITGTVYVNADGLDVTKPPISISVIHPSNVTIEVATDGYPASFTVTTAHGSHRYTRQMKNRRFRYYEGGKRELYQIKTFNPSLGNFQLWGLSPLQAIADEAEQYIASSVHNLSILKRGSTIGGIFKHQSTLSEANVNRLQTQINTYLSGAHNAGRPFLAEGGLDFIPNTQSNKDMDFLELKKNITVSVYNKLSIPLPLINEDTMTMANMEAAKLALYDNAVLPLATRLFNELSIFLLPRYTNSEALKLDYDENTIPALAPRRMTNLKLLRDMNILTINELRKLINKGALIGGDDLYAPNNLIPIASQDASTDAS
jgi:HK97 family phage portal protein